MEIIHKGKRTEEIGTTLTPEGLEAFKARARLAGCTPSELLCDAAYLVLTGHTFSELVAKDRRALMNVEPRNDAVSKA